LRYILIILFTIFSLASNLEVVESFDNSKIHPNINYANQNKQKIEIKKLTPQKRKIYKNSQKKRLKSNKRAKLVIIIDDISHKYQINYIKSLPFKVTPSIFPPSRMNMKSYLLARGLKHYMVHLPLQSDSKAMNRMHKTLFVSDSNKKIRARVAQIKRLFPNVRFINNHTGSIFSQNYTKSKVLYKALLDNNITFLDSRTTQKTKFKKIAKEFNRRYYKNDHFIDNKLSTYAILKEIKKGIALAKKRGYAVIIGHPHKQTFKALKLAQKYLKNVDVVYIDEL
jgi:polysaccharide deacetylase 2 family uncharacterized protein YibQ